jgi:formylglycine-generating enzyme required for sulfatase activity
MRLKSALGIVLLSVALPLFAETCTFEGWRVSESGAAATWAGSRQKTENQPGWYDMPGWQMASPQEFKIAKGPVFVVCDVTADSAYTQELFTNGPAQIRLNGAPAKSLGGGIYQLSLKPGLNTFELQIGKAAAQNDDQAKSKGKKRKKTKSKTPSGIVQFAMRPFEQDYVTQPIAFKIKSARRAIEALGKQYPKYDSTTYLKQLDQLEQNGASDAAIEKFRHQALLLDNPEVDFDQILFRASSSESMPANWRGNSTYLRSHGKESRPTFKDELSLLNIRDQSVKTIYQPADPKEGVMDLALDFDAGKFLYSGVNSADNTFQIYEMNLDGTGKRQITPNLTAIDHYSGTYLPNGKIIFCSTASLNAVPCVAGRDYVGNLFEINADGTDMRQVTFDQENDWYPWVTDDGRVMYLRWEYTDNAHYFTRILMQMNPDGTNLRSIYGSNSYWPNTMFYAKTIPGDSSKFVAICSGHHGSERAGELVLFNMDKGEFEADGVVQRMPGYGKTVDPVVVDKYMDGRWPRFLHPYPLSENFFIVAGQFSAKQKWALYLVDRYDNMVKIADAPGKHMFEPIPVKKRKKPPMIADRRNFEAKDATLFIQDIYEGPGLKDVPRGTVKSMRIFTYGYAYRLGGGHDCLAIEGGWDTKRVLGTVPVEADGSVSVNVPHSMPLSLQPLDENGQALQVMRSWLTAMPGERLSCVGCHESSRTAPPMRVAKAARQAPKELTPWAGTTRPYGFGFKREIQPVLDTYCVGCHNGQANRPDFADTSETAEFAGGHSIKRHFGQSYRALHPYVRRPGPESDMHLLNPMEYHASTSPLMQMLAKGHHGVELGADAYTRLNTWIDLNVPYHPTWLEEQRGDAKTAAKSAQMVEFKKRYAGITDEVDWMPETPIDRPAFIKPAAVKKPAPLTLKGWPLSDAQVKAMATETKTVTIGGKAMTFAKIPAGQFVMGSVTGKRDEYPQSVVTIEKPFWMSVKEITNAEFWAFNPNHSSGAIDMQWKDHVYAGYPANGPAMPAIRVSWNEAMAFCQWASEQSGLKISLPTEAQWEWAARAGSDQPFFFGTSGFEKQANLADKRIGLLAVKGINPQPVPVKDRTPLNDFVPRDDSFDDGRLVPDGTAQYAANPWGLYDLHGNVAEWTRSDYKAYPYSAEDGRNAGHVAEKKVARGGSWRDMPHRATASFRLPYESYQKVANVGFRLVIEQ